MKLEKRDIAKSLGYSFMSVALATATFVPAIAVADASAESPSGNSGSNESEKGGSAAAQAPASKDETVYVHAAADGTIKSEEVSATLKNPEGALSLTDVSNLTAIESKDGDAAYSQSASGVVWNANGGDVTYKGETSAEVPVKVKVSYSLDGAPIEPAELAGKTGHVVVRYDYENTSTRTVEVDGSAQQVSTPFVAVTAVLLDGDVFANVKVKNGKLVEDGDRTIVVGYAMPGLSESLDVSSEDVDIPSYFEFEADARDFELKSTLTMVSPNLFDDMDLDFDTSELAEASSALRQAMGALANGAGELSGGLQQLAGLSSLAADGAGELSSQASGLVGSTGQLASGSRGVATGTSKIYAAAQELDAGLLTVLKGSATQPGLMTTVEQVKQIQEELADLQGLSGQSVGATSSPTSQPAADVSAVEAGLADVQAAAGNTAASTAQAQNDIAAAQAAIQSVDLSGITDPAVRAEIESQLGIANSALEGAGASAQQAAADAASAQNAVSGIDVNGLRQSSESSTAPDDQELTAQDDSEQSKIQKVRQELAVLEQELTALSTGLSTLEQKALAQGILASDALPALVGYSSQIAQGTGQLSAQAPALVSGMDSVSLGASALNTALQAAAAGSQQLAAGAQMLDAEGISLVTDLIDNKIVHFANRFDAVRQAGRDYANFSGLPQGSTGTVKFVYETEPI